MHNKAQKRTTQSNESVVKKNGEAFSVYTSSSTTINIQHWLRDR